MADMSVAFQVEVASAEAEGVRLLGRRVRPAHPPPARQPMPPAPRAGHLPAVASRPRLAEAAPARPAQAARARSPVRAETDEPELPPSFGVLNATASRNVHTLAAEADEYTRYAAESIAIVNALVQAALRGTPPAEAMSAAGRPAKPLARQSRQ